ncbi:MAG: sialidase family protein [Acidimicrobiales bacterium]
MWQSPNARNHLAVHARISSAVGTAVLAVLAAACSSGANPLKPTVADNVRVSGPQPLAFEDPWMARDPQQAGHLAVGYFQRTSATTCYVSLSDNRGATWISRALVGPGAEFPLPTGQKRCTDTALAYAGHAHLYYVFEASRFAHGFFSQLLYTTSGNGGRTFSAPLAVDPTAPAPAKGLLGSDDRAKIAVDHRSGRVYLTWTRYTPHFHKSEVVVASALSGGTFSTPVVVAPAAEFPSVAVGANGKLYVAYQDDQAHQASHSSPYSLDVVASSDQGKTFGAPVTVAKMPVPPSTSGAQTLFPTFTIEAGRGPAQAVVAWSAEQTGSTTPAAGAPGSAPPAVRVQVSVSTDGGTAWSPGRVVGIPPGGNGDRQLRPWLSRAPAGRIDVAYYDFNPKTGIENTYLISSPNDTKSFTAPLKVSTAPTKANLAPYFQKVGVGNDLYLGRMVTSSNSRAYLDWTDDREATLNESGATNGKEDVFFALVTGLG